MKVRKRFIFFLGLVALFLVVAPIVILRARGYQFDFGKGVFVYSGTVSIESNPRDFTVFVNGEETASKKLNRINSSYNFGGLRPQNYEIRVEAPDFQSWTKKIDVHSGVATEFWNVLLVRNNYEKTDYNALGAERFFTSPDNKFIAYSQQTDDNLNVNIFSLKDIANKKSFSIPGYRLMNETNEENIEWSPEDSTLVSVPAEKIEPVVPEKKTILFSKLKQVAKEPAKEYAYFIYNIGDGSTLNLNEFLGFSDIRNVRWDPQEKNYLFFLSKDALYRVSIRDKKTLFLISNNVSAYDLSGGFVYFCDSANNLVFRNSLDGQDEKEQITLSFPESNDSIEKIIIYDESRIALLTKNKKLVIFNQGERDDYFKTIGEAVEGMQFSNDGKKLLFWTGNEISAYFLRDWNVQPERSEDQTFNITRYSETLKNVQWFNDYEHVIFSVGRFTKIAELDYRDRINCMNLPEVSLDNPFVIYNSSLGKLFFTDRKNDSSSLFSIEFPEKTTFLGL